MVRALVYLPDDDAPRLAGAAVAGRTLTVRTLVAARRAGAVIIAVPATLRDASVERALRRLPGLAAAIHWLTPQSEVPADESTPWLLLPASALIHVSALGGLLSAPAPRGAALASSLAAAAPVALAPADLTASVWKDLAAGRPIGAELARRLRQAGAASREPNGPYAPVGNEADLARAEEALQSTLGIAADSCVDRYLHRRVSRRISRRLVRTGVTPNQVSLASLAIGLGAVWCFWDATPASALLGVALYALASILDHADGEIARLTFQESRVGAYLDWTIDTIIHAGIVLGIGVTAGGAAMRTVGALGAAGVTLSALFARARPREIAGGPVIGGVLKTIANRDLFYLLLLIATSLRWLAPSLVGVAAVVVAVGSQAYWVGCVARNRRRRGEPTGLGRPA